MIAEPGSHELLKSLGEVAGIGGAALGVFLLLFRRIQLPTATRRHLTLFMWLVWTLAVLGLATYAFAVLRAQPAEAAASPKTSTPPLFSGSISITYPPNGAFVEFLEFHQGEPVCLNLTIDSSVSSDESYEILDRLDGEALTSGRVSGMTLPLADETGAPKLRLHLNEDRTLPVSTGGPGVYMMHLQGCFDVVATVRSGPEVFYDLTEIDVPIDLKLQLSKSPSKE